jgi:hypothetical protein
VIVVNWVAENHKQYFMSLFASVIPVVSYSNRSEVYDCWCVLLSSDDDGDNGIIDGRRSDRQLINTYVGGARKKARLVPKGGLGSQLGGGRVGGCTGRHANDVCGPN